MDPHWGSDDRVVEAGSVGRLEKMMPYDQKQ
jgi:hypothetical protein